MNRLGFCALVCALVLSGGCAATGVKGFSNISVRDASDPSVEAFLRTMVKEEHFSGVVLVLQNGRIIHASGYGPATTEHANNFDTAYHVASVTKQFTAAAIMQLVESGAIALHNSINGYLPEKFRSHRWDAVTVHQLLSHSSGIADYATVRDYYEIAGGFASDETIDGMIVESMPKELEFSPGSKYAYSNLGYVLLGEIIENQTNTSFADYVMQNILKPMSMDSSRVRTEGHVTAKNEAAGFRWSEVQAALVKDDSETLPATPADAGLITTLGDFAKWSQIFAGGDQSILSKESVRAMTSQHIQMGRGGSVDAYGYGLGVGDRLLAHSGHVVGFRSQIILDRQTNTLIAVFSNNSAIDMQRVAFGLLTVMFAPPS